MTEIQAYPDPISQFLAFKENTTWQDEWIDYLSKFGFTKADVPELSRLSWYQEDSDDDDDLANDSSLYIHALRALAQIEPEDLKPKTPEKLLQLRKTLLEFMEKQTASASARPVAKGFGGRKKVKPKKKKR